MVAAATPEAIEDLRSRFASKPSMQTAESSFQQDHGQLNELFQMRLSWGYRQHTHKIKIKRH